MRATARITSHGLPGMVADEAPGCCGAIRTRRACGLVWKRSAGSSCRALRDGSNRMARPGLEPGTPRFSVVRSKPSNPAKTPANKWAPRAALGDADTRRFHSFQWDSGNDRSLIAFSAGHLAA